MSRASEMHGFLPEDYVELKAQRRTNILWALVFAIVAGSIGWAYFIAQTKIQQAEAMNAQVNRDFASAASSVEQFKQMQEEQSRLNLKAELVGSLVERVNRSNILAQLTNALPANVYLSECDLTGKPQIDASQAKTAYDRAKAAGDVKPIIYAVTMKVRGYAFTNSQVSDYMVNLEKCGLFSQVDFMQAVESTYKDVKLREFELELTLDPNADSRAVEMRKSVADASE